MQNLTYTQIMLVYFECAWIFAAYLSGV